MDAIELWHSIIDAKADYEAKYGHAPWKLKLPLGLAQVLTALGREQLGDLSERVMNEGIKVFERGELLGVPVEIVRGTTATFPFE